MLTELQVKKRQDIAGAAFIAVVVVDVAVRILKLAGIVDPLMSWYIAPVGLMAVFGYYMLYSIASSSIAEIFALCQGVIVAFFSLLATFVIYSEIDINNNFYTPILLVACMGFVMLSMYLHTVLLNSGKFERESLSWIALVPLPYVGDVCRYYCWYQNYVVDGSRLSNWDVNNEVSNWVAWFVLVVAAIGNWRLCHSKPYSAQTDDFSMPHWSPVNRYFLGYAVAVMLVFLIY